MVQVPDTPENEGQCICGGCPTYNECMRERTQALFCARDKSECEIEKNGCLCGACPLASDFRLDKMYYCTTGSEL
jgi:hypothetical protein